MPDNDKLQREFTGSETIQDLAKDFGAPEQPNPPFEPPMSKSQFEKMNQTTYLQFNLDLQVEKLEHYQGLPDLKQATPGSVGIDLFAANFEPIHLNSIGASVVVPTGIKIELPHGLEAQIRPRSGLAAKDGITVLNAPGTVDSDYRGEIKVILAKLTTGKFRVERGMRIAQMVIAPVIFPRIVYVDRVGDTSRGEAGFGSSGIKY